MALYLGDNPSQKINIKIDDYESGYKNGQKDEYDRFWKAYQQSGGRRNYLNAFSGVGWNGDTFKPKYGIVVTVPNNCFQEFDGAIDLEERLNEQGVTLNLSSCGYLTNFFYRAKFTRLPYLNAPNCNNITNICSGCTNLTNFKLTAGTVSTILSAFSDCTSLTDVELNCIIATSINFQWSPLTRQSIESVMAALSTTKTGQTATFQKAAVETAFTTEEWNALAATRTNWTITLV